MAAIEVMRGDVVLVDLDPAQGAEKMGKRPCVVVQNNMGNEKSPNTIIVPATNASGKKTYPFQVLLPKGEGGLQLDSIAGCEQIRVIDRTRIIKKLGTLSPSYISEIDNAIRISLAL